MFCYLLKYRVYFLTPPLQRETQLVVEEFRVVSQESSLQHYSPPKELKQSHPNKTLIISNNKDATASVLAFSTRRPVSKIIPSVNTTVNDIVKITIPLKRTHVPSTSTPNATSSLPLPISHYISHYHTSVKPKSPNVYLFIVNFHWSKYKQVPFIRKEYFKKFSTYFNADFDVVITGPKGDIKNKVINNRLPQGGFYSYYSMPFIYHLLCEEQSCKYNGFFLMNDDSYIDAQFLNKYNLTRSWSEPSQRYDPVKHRKWAWPNAKNINGVPFKKAYNNAIKEMEEKGIGKVCKFSDDNNRRRGYADAFYLTSKDVKLYNEIALVMFNHKVFLEMASPTAMYCVSHSFLNNCNHGPMRNRKTCVHMHPVKYRLPRMKGFAMQRLDHKNLKSLPTLSY